MTNTAPNTAATLVQTLPTPDMVVSLLVRNGAPGSLGVPAVHKEVQAWAKRLTPPSEGHGPRWADQWLWLPLCGETSADAAHYFLHTGTGRVWDAWTGQWCPSEWVIEKNTPRMGCVWRQPHITWQQLGQLLALTALQPAKPPGIRWAVALPPDHAAFLRAHEEKYGPGTGCFDVYSLRWTRRGKPSKDGVVYPFRPLAQYVIDLGRE